MFEKHLAFKFRASSTHFATEFPPLYLFAYKNIYAHFLPTIGEHTSILFEEYYRVLTDKNSIWKYKAQTHREKGREMEFGAFAVTLFLSILCEVSTKLILGSKKMVYLHYAPTT